MVVVDDHEETSRVRDSLRDKVAAVVNFDEWAGSKIQVMLTA
jgi:hypothetical protein